MNTNIRPIAIYLPQYHPIPENDAWWGKGFTEWTNVAKAKPLFKGHYQPHLPADLGFYDLRLPEAREAQAELARSYGIYGFCYYHYWFNGKRLLERPFNEVLASGKPDFPFCLCWANETWSRRWLGEEKEVLLKQTYSEKDDYNHIHSLIPAFADNRYIKVHGRPLFIIYRPMGLPNPQKTIEIFHNECVKAGIKPPYMVGANAHHIHINFKDLGFDDILDFAPQLGVLGNIFDNKRRVYKMRDNLKFGIINPLLKIYDYTELYRLMNERKLPYNDYLPSVFVSWDNSPRRGVSGIIVKGATPQVFEEQLNKAIAKVENRPEEEQLVFINAWNEWAEGNHLEPDMKFGDSFLKAVKKALDTSVQHKNIDIHVNTRLNA